MRSFKQISHNQKQVPLTVIASLDFSREWHEGEIKSPFYTICQDGRWLSVKYYGVCEVNRSLSLEEAKQFVYSQLTRYSGNLQDTILILNNDDQEIIST